MSSQTPNLGLTLPTGSENVSRQIINDNNTIIDDAYGTVSSDITALNGNLSNYIVKNNNAYKLPEYNGNLNDLKTPGRWYIQYTSTNLPVSTGGFMDVYVFNANFIKQVFYTQNATDFAPYVRTCYNGSWSAWALIATAEQLFFGSGHGKYYETYKTDIDSAIDDTINPINDATGYFTINNSGSVPNFGNRQFIFGWVNTAKNYGWCLVLSFGGIGYGSRTGASAFTIRSLI